MSRPGTVVLRRTWPQRLVIVGCVGVIAAGLAVAWFIGDVYETVRGIPRVDISGDILLTDTEPGEPVNFLLIGEDSTLRLDDDDPVNLGRDIDPQLRFQADSITILRVDPTAGQAWVLSLPRDLLVERNGSERKINSVYFVEQEEGLIEAISDNFDIPINHFISLDFFAFRSVVNELGGIPVWFDNPARDLGPKDVGSGLNIASAGCHVLDGVEALQYVRARWYEELIDGEWVRVGNSDLGRIERQQDFLVLALQRAIDRGARSPTTLIGLIEAGAESVTLDGELTIAELVDVGRAFSDFDPESLQRLELQIDTVWIGAEYQGESLRPAVNEPLFEIFRGAADLARPEDVEFDLYWEPAEGFDRVGELLDRGFTIDDTYTMEAPVGPSVIVYPPGERSEAETVALWLLPIPRLVEDPDARTMSVILGDEHEQVLFFSPHTVQKMRSGVAEQGDGPIPDVSAAVRSDTTTTEAAPTPTTTPSPPSSTAPAVDSEPVEGAPGGETATTTTQGGVIGQAPDGESCG